MDERPLDHKHLQELGIFGLIITFNTQLLQIDWFGCLLNILIWLSYRYFLPTLNTCMLFSLSVKPHWLFRKCLVKMGNILLSWFFVQTTIQCLLWMLVKPKCPSIILKLNQSCSDFLNYMIICMSVKLKAADLKNQWNNL